jgi:hypothetical protein
VAAFIPQFLTAPSRSDRSSSNASGINAQGPPISFIANGGQNRAGKMPVPIDFAERRKTKRSSNLHGVPALEMPTGPPVSLRTFAAIFA